MALGDLVQKGIGRRGMRPSMLTPSEAHQTPAARRHLAPFRSVYPAGAITGLTLIGGVIYGLEKRSLTSADCDSTIPKWVDVPASAGASGTAGQMAYDSSYLYVCVASSTWRRIAHSTW